MSRKPVVFVTRKLPDDVHARLRRDYDPKLNETDRQFGAEELPERTRGCDALLPCPSDRLTGPVIKALPASIKIIATFSVGYEHIDVAAAKARGIVVTNTPDVLTDATAEIAILLLLGAARRAHEGERMVREATWSSWAPTAM